MDVARREAIEKRWQAIDEKLKAVRLTGKSPIEGVDAEFYSGQLLEELDEMEYELGLDYFEDKRCT